MTDSQSKLKYILTELRDHAPFTAFGSLLGVVFMFGFRNTLSGETSRLLFDFFHPAHVVLSAIATAAMFKLHSKKRSFLLLLIIGYVGSVGIATLSDTLIPHFGRVVLDIHVEGHAHGHSAEHDAKPGSVDHAVVNDQHSGREHPAADNNNTHHKDGKMHIGFIDNWYIVNPAAIIGVLIAYFWPNTKFPHAGHVLLSVWASLFYILMAIGPGINIVQWIGIFVFLFIAVWLPCCVSDIVFPLLFVKPGQELGKHEH